MLQPSLNWVGAKVQRRHSGPWNQPWMDYGVVWPRVGRTCNPLFWVPWRNEQRAASVKASTSVGGWGGCIRGQQGREFPLPPQTEESLVQLYRADHHLPFDVEEAERLAWQLTASSRETGTSPGYLLDSLSRNFSSTQWKKRIFSKIKERKVVSSGTDLKEMLFQCCLQWCNKPHSR